MGLVEVHDKENVPQFVGRTESEEGFGSYKRCTSRNVEDMLKLDRLSKETNKLVQEKFSLELALKREKDTNEALRTEMASTKDSLKNLKRAMSVKLTE